VAWRRELWPRVFACEYLIKGSDLAVVRRRARNVDVDRVECTCCIVKKKGSFRHDEGKRPRSHKYDHDPSLPADLRLLNRL